MQRLPKILVKPNQYAFDEHHSKFETHVQQLRPAPAVPYISGFTLPTCTKDAETSACFKQLLLRPHRCRGSAYCTSCSASADCFTSCIIRRVQ